jgi:hypothetical protein
MLVVVIPALHVMNRTYVQRIAMFLGAAQMAYLAFIGKFDHQISELLVNGFNHAVSCSFNVIIQKLMFGV